MRLRRQHLRCQGSLVGDGVIDVGPLAGRRTQQRLRSGELDIGVGQSSAGVGDRGFLLLHRGLERRPLQTIEQIALFDLGALGKQTLVEKSGHPRGQRDTIDRLHAADELRRFGDRRLLRPDHADGRWAAGHLGEGD